MLLCLLAEVVSYLFYSQQLTGPFPNKEQKEEQENETPGQVFSGEFCEIFKNTFFLKNTSGQCQLECQLFGLSAACLKLFKFLI